MSKPAYLQNLPHGVEVRQSAKRQSIRIHFTYQGIRCKETLKGKAVNKANIAFAEKKLALINAQIADGSFCYADHFPNSKRAERIYGGRDINRTVADGLKSYLAIKKNQLAPSGYRAYASKANKHLLPYWGERRIRDIKKTEIQTWQLIDLPAAGLSDKTINLLFTVFRGIFDNAYGDQIISFNPMTLIKNLENPDNQGPDPFTAAELKKLLTLKTHKQQEINAYGFNARTGLRLSELLGLAWEDVDLDAWTISIRRGRVANEYRVPKTKDSLREIKLQREAIEWLERQKAWTYMLPPAEVKVRQRNSRSFETEQLRFVFHNSSTGKPWSGDTTFRKVFGDLLRKARVRYRGPNQLRHTFASWLLTNAIPLEWIAPIMGTSVTMLRKHYATMINEDRPNLGGIIETMLQGQLAKLDDLKENGS